MHFKFLLCFYNHLFALEKMEAAYTTEREGVRGNSWFFKTLNSNF